MSEENNSSEQTGPASLETSPGQTGQDKPKVYSEEQFNGLLADKQAEVKKRQQLERELAEVKVQTPAAESDADNKEKPLTIGEFEKLMADQKQTDAETAFRVREAETEKSARESFTAEKCGDGLDFDSVIAAGEANLTEGDRLAIRQAKDPAAEKYRRCLMLTPELAEKAETVRTSQLLEKVKLTGRVPGSGGGGSQATAAADDVSGMSEEELDKLAESLS